MAKTIDDLLGEFHSFIAERADESYHCREQRYPNEFQPSLKEHYERLSKSALTRIKDSHATVAANPFEKAIEDSLFEFDAAVINSANNCSFSTWQELMVYAMPQEDFARKLVKIREAYKAVMPKGTLNRKAYDAVADALKDAFSAALFAAYIPHTQESQETLSTRYKITYKLYDRQKLIGEADFTRALQEGRKKTNIGKLVQPQSVFYDFSKNFADDKTLSKHHCWFEEKADGIYVVDWPSKNGTRSVDYSGKQDTRKRKDGQDLTPIPKLLAPITNANDSIKASAEFGRFKIELYLTKKG